VAFFASFRCKTRLGSGSPQEIICPKCCGRSLTEPRDRPKVSGFTRLDTERANQRELDSFRQPVLTPDVIYDSDGSILARDLTEYTLYERTKENAPAHRAKDEVPDSFAATFREIWELPSKLDVHFMAGSRLYAGGPGVVEAIETAGQKPEVVWRAEFEGTPQRMLAADGQLFIVDGRGQHSGLRRSAVERARCSRSACL
jgi:hypothetical protein